MLTNMLSDQQLCTHHATMKMLLNIRINDQLWHGEDKKEVIDRALYIDLDKHRNVSLSKAVLESIEEPLTKKACVEMSDNDDDDLSNEWDDLLYSSSTFLTSILEIIENPSNTLQYSKNKNAKVSVHMPYYLEMPQ